MGPAAADSTATSGARPVPTSPAPGRRVLESLLGVPFSEGNRIEVLRNGNEGFPALLGDIRASRSSIDLLWFLWGKGPVTEEVAEALIERARAGVRVRVLLDGFGSKGADPRLVSAMRAAGCLLRFYHPMRSLRLTAMNMRTHRRALICDESRALTGGLGIDTAWTGDGDSPGNWRDTAFRVRGPAVAGIRAAFATAWVQTPEALVTEAEVFPALPREGTAAVQVLRPSSQPGWNDAAVAVIALLRCARSRVRITTPYSRMPHLVLDPLTSAARRGVQVQLLVPGPHVDRTWVHRQSQHDYGPLLDAGVEVWQYQPSMVHAKVVTVDHQLALVGTTNVDARSFALNEQVGLVIDDSAVADVLDRHYEDDLSRSVRLDRDEWAARPRRERLVDNLANSVGFPLRGLGAVGLSGLRP